MIKYVDQNGLKRFAEFVNERINNVVANGLHQCKSCGAPYMGKPTCEYCGRSFFVDFKTFKEQEDGRSL